jgi:hypothetical protein
VHENKKRYGYYYLVNKKQFTVKQRDFYEKGFSFCHNGRFYRYSCSVIDSEKLKPKFDKDTVRGDTLLNF